MEKMESKKNKSDFVPPEYLKMYEISGQDTINQHSFDRYLKDKQQDSFIEKLAENSLDVLLENNYVPKQKEEISAVEKTMTEKIRSTPKKDRTSLIKKSLENFNVEIQKVATDLITYAPREERVFLIKQALENPDVEVRKSAVMAAWSVPEKDKLELFSLITEKGLGEELIKSPLYEDKKINKEDFSRQKFEKTGSDTTLIGGELKNKVIIRHITPKAFLAWQKSYEDYKIWEEGGFDYVPIEPIVSYRLDDKKGLIDVSSGILDLNILGWSEKTEMFIPELTEIRKKIIDVLKKLNITHGHTNYSNFCLKFFRDEKGHPDFSRTPRLYLIDFDRAVSPI